ncbi:response regulator [Luteolibacter sp. GHJ8]|jgi:signal transduction histidine kinase|uniref:histidine kinase n=1 Tax=Luteolibacter rhizosphaerae TaxID=2989719 RepID=A0ABT3FX30_9BACT|nr:response regulator [Luteolibacter rhizosphaerae]MCW1912135.1 response regulator [Luteolibacter rhizosphaerae]
MTVPIKFLLVDDLEANLVALEGLLKRDGLELLKAHSGPEALELLLQHDVALALLDVQMPEMGGFELAEIMRSTERTRHVPIIFLTAGVVDQERRIQGYETGAVDFLPKPIDAKVLLNKAEVFHALAKQRQDLRRANEQLARSNAELERADRSKNEFLAMLAHELRNPLAPLRNAALALKNRNLDGEQHDRIIAMIDRQVGNLSHMIDDLLDVSRITEGKIELRCQPVELQSLLGSAATAAAESIRANGQELVLDLPAEPLHLDADSTRLEQIVGNLLTNACKYSGTGSRISLSARAAGTPDKPEVEIRVADNGNGIAPELLPRIFGLFVQGSRTIDRTNDGLGIGLTIVQRLVQLHGGTITAHSGGLGMGSEFVIRLPSLASYAQAPSPKSPVESARALRILIVDDNRDSADSMGMLLEIGGHEVTIAHHGTDALAKAEEFQPEVVLLDIGLPGMDGFEVARQLRGNPAHRDAFLIAVTGYGSDEDQTRAKEAGFDQHLVKPADLRKLRGWLQEVGTQ